MSGIFERYDRVECVSGEMGIRQGDIGSVYDIDTQENMIAVIPDGCESWHWFDIVNFRKVNK